MNFSRKETLPEQLRHHEVARAFYGVVQKALAARIPVVAAISAPSSLAAQFALANGMTLIGFLRPRRLNVYANAHRIKQSS